MLNYVVNRKAALVRLGNKVIRQFPEMPFALAPAGGFVGPRRNECANAPARLNHPGPFQLGINFGDRVCVDPQIDRQLPDGRQLIPDAQPLGGNRKANRPFQLRVKRRWVFGVYLKHR